MAPWLLTWSRKVIPATWLSWWVSTMSPLEHWPRSNVYVYSKAPICHPCMSGRTPLTCPSQESLPPSLPCLISSSKCKRVRRSCKQFPPCSSSPPLTALCVCLIYWLSHCLKSPQNPIQPFACPREGWKASKEEHTFLCSNTPLAHKRLMWVWD